jgi:ferritin-like metal-binding protein YciE
LRWVIDHSQPKEEFIMATKRKAARRPSKESPDATELLVLELQAIHSAETQLVRALPRLLKAVDSDKLTAALEERQAQGERLLEEVEAALEELDETPGRKKNVAAEGLINDAREHVQEIEAGPALDAVLIAAMQKTEHYCIAAWGTAKALGEALRNKSTVKSMERALKEGKAMDEQLTQLALEEIMPALQSAESAEEEESEEGVEEEATAAAPKSRRKGSSEDRASR